LKRSPEREDVLIGNVNRCRPPGNRQPTLEEAAICRHFYSRDRCRATRCNRRDEEYRAENLLEVREGITRVRESSGLSRHQKSCRLFHPAYLLRDPSKKRETWKT